MRPWPAVSIVLLLAAPLAGAEWGAKGSREPDTWRDAVDGFATLTPDVSPDAGVRKLYFNGFLGTNAGYATSFNPNQGRVSSAFMAHPAHPMALLGVWKDCNGDGYVGHGEEGLFEYPATLLANSSICRADLRSPAQEGFLVHNDGQWVQEFHPVGYDDVNADARGRDVDQNPYNYNDTGARVWADFDLPESSLRGSCALSPPPGSLRTVGGVLRWADCLTGYKGLAALDEGLRAAGHPELGFGDAPRERPDQSRSPLNQRNPWGDEADKPIVRAFDCSDPGFDYAVMDPTGGGLRSPGVTLPDGTTVSANLTDQDGRVLRGTVRLPALFMPDPEGSPAGTVNETEEAVDKCDRNDDAYTMSETPYLIEGRVEPTSPSVGRTRPDFTFMFEEGDRRPGGARGVLGAGWRGPDADGGTGVATLTGLWVATSTSTLSRNPFVQREALGPEPVTYLTYYAHVSWSLITNHGLRTPGGAGLYGASACALTPSAFDCDPSRWWRDASGSDIMPRDARLGSADGGITPRQIPATEIGVRVFQPYRLRDIDCYDQSADGAREAGLTWGVVTDSECARPPRDP